MTDDELYFEADHDSPATTLPVPFLLDLLAWRRASGKVQVMTEMDVYGVYIDQGRILAATSTHRTLRLGHLLLQRGAVEAVFLHDILHGRRTLPTGRALGGMLVAEGAITVEDLAATVEEQVVEILSRLLTLDQATFLLVADEPLPSGMEIIPLDTGDMLEAATSRLEERAAVHAMERLLPRPDVPLALTIHLALVSHKLTDAEILVALQIDRNRSNLHMLVSSLPLDALTVKRTIIGLLERDFIRADYGPRSADAAPSG